MYCKNCGNEMDENATVCTKCGCAKGTGNSFCSHCGEPANAGAAICLKCGCAISEVPGINGYSTKSRTVAGVLAILLGQLGIHNFYLGFTNKGLMQLLISIIGSIFTFGLAAIGVWIWALIEGIQILTNKDSVDAEGKILQG